MLKSRDLIILSSSIGDLLARNRLPQGATGCPRFWPRPPAKLPKSVLPPAQECQIAYLGTLSSPVEPKWHQSLPSSDPSEPKASKIEPKVIAIQAKRYPSRATWSSEELILGDSSLRGRQQRRQPVNPPHLVKR